MWLINETFHASLRHSYNLFRKPAKFVLPFTVKSVNKTLVPRDIMAA